MVINHFSRITAYLVAFRMPINITKGVGPFIEISPKYVSSVDVLALV